MLLIIISDASTPRVLTFDYHHSSPTNAEPIQSIQRQPDFTVNVNRNNTVPNNHSVQGRKNRARALRRRLQAQMMKGNKIIYY